MDISNADIEVFSKLALIFDAFGCATAADAILEKGITIHPENISLKIAYAELASKRSDWSTAVYRWQNVAALQGEETPVKIYRNLDEAYQKLGSFPKGTPEEESHAGDGDKYEMLTLIHNHLNPKMYLEIGVQAGVSLALAKCEAIGIDPMPHVSVELPKGARVLAMTSDDFFHYHADLLVENPPDMVFIDGMHLFEYTLRDFIKVERQATPGTLVVIDDIFPAHPAQAERQRKTRTWTGDVWKLFEILNQYRTDLLILPVNVSPTGFLLIAGLNPNNQILGDNYDAVVEEYSTKMNPPKSILEREWALSSKHEAIPNVLSTLKSAREKCLDMEEIAECLDLISTHRL
jgi:Methyltransferase domain